MAIDRGRLSIIFGALGASLAAPTRLCLIGSAPAILLGQAERQTQDIDVWSASCDYDAGDLERACVKIGLSFDPTDEIDPQTVYLQIVRAGMVALPRDLATETLARYGMLRIVMPEPAILAAMKLARGSERWWVNQRALDQSAMQAAIGLLPRDVDRQTAAENLILVRLVTGERR